MKKLRFVLLTLAFVSINIPIVNSQSVDKIVANHIKALGGKKVIKSISSIYMENTIDAMGNESPSKTIILNGKGLKTITDINGQSMIQCYTDKGGWIINPMMGSSEPEKMSVEQYNSGKTQINIDMGFIDYKKHGNKVELLGKEKLKNVDVFKIKLTTSDSLSIICFIDATNYLLVQTNSTTDMMGQKVELITEFSNYETTSYGYSLPKKSILNFGSEFTLDIKMNKVEFNVPVDPTIFELGNLK